MKLYLRRTLVRLDILRSFYWRVDLSAIGADANRRRANGGFLVNLFQDESTGADAYKVQPKL